jgi:hypothetical protein
MTGRYALHAQKQAANDQRRSERRAANGVLEAIAAELRVLKRDNFDPLRKQLNDRHESA